MKELIDVVKDQVATVTDLKYVDEDWGQLDYYSPNYPVKWPCALVDINSIVWNNLGEHKQDGIAQVSIHVATIKLSNTNVKAPTGQKTKSNDIFTLLTKIQKKLHGWAPSDQLSIGPLTRLTTRKIKRDDGVREFEVIYVCQVVDIDAKITYTPMNPKPAIDLKVGKIKSVKIQLDTF